MLAGHRGEAETARSLLGDREPEVRAAALSALARAGSLSDEDLDRALHDQSPLVRVRACELAAARPGVDLLAGLDDPDTAVVETAAWACGEQGSAAAVARLVELAGAHPDPLCRESAVAALGAIGDDHGLPAVLAALEDRPAIRRRAVLALAPFEGEEVEAALRKALTDRDWQVRQGAEDLLGD